MGKISMRGKKVFVKDNNQFSLVCPKCMKIESVDTSMYKESDDSVRMDYRCPCGYVYHLLLEKRKYYRKETHLPGTYFLGEASEKPMIVKDMSLTGLKFKVDHQPDVVVGDRLFVKFFLDDAQKTLIRKEVIIKIISGRSVGAEFCPENASDKAIEFYLIP